MIISRLGASFDPSRKVRLYLFLFVLSILIFISGARLVSSDEVSMYLTIETIVENGTLAIPMENAPNSTTIEGKSYTWYEAGNIIAGIPLYIIGKVTASILPLSDTLKMFLHRATVSLSGAFYGAWIAVLLFSILKKFGVSLRLSVGMALALTLSTFLLPYYKMFMREPILALCLLGTFGSLLPDSNNHRTNRALIIAGIFTGYGILTKLSYAINLLPIVFYLLLYNAQHPENFRERVRQLFVFFVPICFIGFGGTMLYNFLRFGDPFNTGYAGGTAFSTPFYVGIYGLIMSSGKGILWFAPMVFLLIPAQRYFRAGYPRETLLIASLFLLNLLLASVYIAWAGDGSWGPRYLAPFLPLFFVPIAFYINQANRITKKISILLAALGFIIQIGGIGIYAGAYLREIGEYPYQRPFDDPEFLYKAHFIPDYSPVIGHWRMLTRNTVEHLDGNYPNLSINHQSGDQRLPIADNEKIKLLHTLDFWFTYALYANIPKKIIVGAVLLLITLCGISGYFLYRNTPKTV